MELLHSQLESLVRQYGLRRVVNGLSWVCQEAADANQQLPYNDDQDHLIDPDELRTAAAILAGDLLTPARQPCSEFSKGTAPALIMVNPDDPEGAHAEAYNRAHH